MALQTYDVTLAATATAQPIVATVATTRHPIQELHIENPTGNQTVYVGTSTVSSSSYGRSVAAGSAIIIGNGPAAISIECLEHVYLSGTQNNVIHVLVITL